MENADRTEIGMLQIVMFVRGLITYLSPEFPFLSVPSVFSNGYLVQYILNDPLLNRPYTIYQFIKECMERERFEVTVIKGRVDTTMTK